MKASPRSLSCMAIANIDMRPILEISIREHVLTSPVKTCLSVKLEGNCFTKIAFYSIVETVVLGYCLACEE